GLIHCSLTDPIMLPITHGLPAKAAKLVRIGTRSTTIEENAMRIGSLWAAAAVLFGATLLGSVSAHADLYGMRAACVDPSVATDPGFGTYGAEATSVVYEACASTTPGAAASAVVAEQRSAPAGRGELRATP